MMVQALGDNAIDSYYISWTDSSHNTQHSCSFRARLLGMGVLLDFAAFGSANFDFSVFHARNATLTFYKMHNLC